MAGMAPFGTLVGGKSNVRNIGTGLLLVAGLGLTGYGSYIHLTVTARVGAGQCDGCAPWHPLFVLTPLLIGVGMILMAAYRRFQR